MRACWTPTAVSSTSRLLLAAFLCILALPRAATACPFAAAVYIPDPGDSRPKADYYRYTLTAPDEGILVLNILDPSTDQTETKLRMPYHAGATEGAGLVLDVSKKESLSLQFLNKDFIEVLPAGEDDEAPAYVLLHESYAKFLDLPEEDLDVRYMTAKRVRPGARVEDRLELIPDTWVLDTCSR